MPSKWFQRGSWRVLFSALALSACDSESGTTPDTLVMGRITPDATAGDSAQDVAELTLDAVQAEEVNVAVPDAEDAPSCPGGFGCPCANNDACGSGFCVQTDTGAICTVQCTDACPTGFECKGISSGGPDLSFVCMPKADPLCVPCATDSDCPGTVGPDTDGSGNARCVQDGIGGGRCGRSCDLDSDCPAGFECDPAQGLDGAEAGTQWLRSRQWRAPCRDAG